MSGVKHFSKSQKGASLIEVMVSAIILAIGLLGMAGLVVSSMHSSYSSTARSASSMLASDIIDRIRLNRDRAISSNDYVIGANQTVVKPDCVTNECTPAQLAQADLAVLKSSLAAQIPGGTVQIERNANTYTVTVSWPARATPAKASDSHEETVSFVLSAEV